MEACLKVKMIKRSCSFYFRIEYPLATVGVISYFLHDKYIQVERLQLMQEGISEASFLVKCWIEKELVQDMLKDLGKLPGVIGVELGEEYLVKNNRQRIISKT